MNTCRFIMGAHADAKGPDYDYCDAPASIKRDGVWLCAEHYDFCEENSTAPAQDPFGIQ